jgi:hypothetical protein
VVRDRETAPVAGGAQGLERSLVVRERRVEVPFGVRHRPQILLDAGAERGVPVAGHGERALELLARAIPVAAGEMDHRQRVQRLADEARVVRPERDLEAPLRELERLVQLVPAAVDVAQPAKRLGEQPRVGSEFRGRVDDGAVASDRLHEATGQLMRSRGGEEVGERCAGSVGRRVRHQRGCPHETPSRRSRSLRSAGAWW